MKRLFFLAAALLLIWGLPLPVRAAPLSDEVQGQLEQQLQSLGAQELANELPGEARDILEELDLGEIDLGALLSLSPGDFVRVVKAQVKNTVQKPLATLGMIAGVVVLCALVDTLKSGLSKGTLSPVFSTVSVLCVITVIAKPIGGCIVGAAEAIRGCANFMLSFIPVFCSIVTVGGAPVTATSYNLLLFFACQLISSFASSVLVPFMGIYMGLCVAGSVGEDIGVLPLAKGVRSFVTWSLTLTMTAYVGLLSMQTLVSVGADNAMLKTGKFLVGSFVPIVGGAISEALSAAQGALHLLKSAVGAFGMVAGAAAFLPILVRVLLWYFTVKVAAFLAQTLSLKKLGSLLGACSDCLGTMLALLFSFLLLILVSIILLLSFSATI
ncbi:stage III sporulation protein AE [Provencibacterium massiliense]|uniref:stage III sporulation protein AE n=1 Tax=Provencibacterium massiliense TaxID=1841868 RepID=UPI0009A8AFAD|nr:hypothetical protein [Provencibacterium massiliense]RGB66482.1 hypothetical protein DW086_08390 [Harryflintia acetispora]